MTYKREDSDDNPIYKSEFSERDRNALNKLLDLAEVVQRTHYTLRRRIMMFTGATATLAIGVLTYITSGSRSSSVLEIMAIPVNGALLSLLFAAYVGGVVWYLSMRRQTRREEAAFKEVMGIVHEVFEGTKPDLSALEIAEIKIRLSRLDH